MRLRLILLSVWLAGCYTISSAPEAPTYTVTRPLQGLRDSSRVERTERFAVTGATRALMVFVRFRDDIEPGDPCLNERGWPSEGSKALPSYARHLLASSPNPPFPDSSLTDYFYLQSGGRFALYGDVYPEVIVSQMDTDDYRRSARRGYGYLTAEILNLIDPQVDFRKYDTNPADGVVDQIFIVVRRDPAATFTGVANLYGADRVAGRPRNRLEFDGVEVDWSHSGSYLIHTRPGNIFPQTYFVRLMAHEYGHHLWNSRGFFEGGHVKAITSNDTPANGTDRIGYVLMAGRGGGRDNRGDELISAFERDLLGWTDYTLLNNQKTNRSTYRLGDAYTTGDLAKLELRDGNPSTTDPILYLENRQRFGPFDRPRTIHEPGCRAFRMAHLQSTGLLITMAEINGSRTKFDVLPADNTLAMSSEEATYQGDLFGPDTRTQLTPWTRPGTARPDGTPTWTAIDNIRYVDQRSRMMTFDFVKDFRRDPIIRAPSWMSVETDGTVFETRVTVEARQPLTIKQATITFAAGLHLDPNAVLEIAPDAQVTISGPIDLKRGALIRIRPGGRLDANGQVHTSSTTVLTLSARNF